MKRTILILLILFGAVLPVMAQEATSEPAATVEAPGAGESTQETGSTDSDVTLSIWQIITGVAGAFALGGIAGVAGAGVLASRLRNDPATMSAIEKLGDSVPQATATLIIGLAKSSQEIAELLKEALDRIPASSKSAPPAQPAG